MRSIIKSSFLWQFVSGFALGAAAFVALAPAQAEPLPYAAPSHVAR